MEKGRIEFDDPTFRENVQLGRHIAIDRGLIIDRNTDQFIEAGVKAAMTGAVPPLDMLIFCPSCGKQHIDQPEPFGCQTCGLYGENDCICDVFNPWLNPPHKSHTCRIEEDGGCGQVFRVADFPTNGVAQITTRGKDDTWFPVDTAPEFAAIPKGYTRRGPDEIIKTNDLYFNGQTYVEVPKVPAFVGTVGDRPEPIIYRTG